MSNTNQRKSFFHISTHGSGRVGLKLEGPTWNLEEPTSFRPSPKLERHEHFTRFLIELTSLQKQDPL
jgi:hypothetical protein